MTHIFLDYRIDFDNSCFIVFGLSGEEELIILSRSYIYYF